MRRPEMEGVTHEMPESRLAVEILVNTDPFALDSILLRRRVRIAKLGHEWPQHAALDANFRYC
jgi:hypothetical protein